MSGESIERAEPQAIDPADRSLMEDLRLLASDARTLAEAEVAYQKSRANVFAGNIGKIVALGALALLLVVLALIALVVGLVFAFVPVLTAWGATALVTGVLIVLALLAASWARSRWRRLHALVFGNEGAA